MELETETRVLPNLLSLGSAEETELRDRISRWNGLCRVFIHPLYEKWRWGTEYYRNDAALKRLLEIEQGLEKLVRMPSEKVPPIIIFEEKKFTDKLESWASSNRGGANIYIVETDSNNPVPADYWNKEKTGWKILCDLFTSLGISKILMGGVRLEISSYMTDWTGKAPYVCRCVGIALSHLSNKKAGPFTVEVSTLTDPAGAREYLNTFN